MDKPLEIEFAKRGKLRFLQSIESLLLRILRHPEALVTDESTLWDFCIDDADDAIGPGQKCGSYLFKRRFFLGNALTILRDSSQWQEEIYEARAVPFRKTTTRKIFRHTGVDVTPVFDEHFPVILHYIAARVPERTRLKLKSSFILNEEPK
jgi:hypothetical protein